MRGHLVRSGFVFLAALAVGSCEDEVGLTSIPPDPERYIAFMNGANIATPVTTPALGQAVVTVSGTNDLIYRIDLSNIDSVTLSHIHRGAAGVSGGVLVNLYVPPSPTTGLDFSGMLIEDTAFAVHDTVMAQLRSGLTYVNVHTRGNGGGEIRGQLFRFQ
jgi:CHRD domain-containing protein